MCSSRINREFFTTLINLLNFWCAQNKRLRQQTRLQTHLTIFSRMLEMPRSNRNSSGSGNNRMRWVKRMFIDTAPHALFIRNQGVQKASPENECLCHIRLGVWQSVARSSLRLYVNSCSLQLRSTRCPGTHRSRMAYSAWFHLNPTLSIRIWHFPFQFQQRFELRQRVHFIVVVVQLKLICKFVQLSTWAI